MTKTILAFRDVTPEQRPNAGGKGGTLSLLFQKRYPVPAGIIAMPSAFSGDEITLEAWSELQSCLEILRKSYPDTAFSVRSSAIAEDSALASFAGEFETVLDVSTDEEIMAAVNEVRSSRNSERVRTYSQAQGIEPIHEMAVVIQWMIHADISGVLFTADPVTGDLSVMVGNYVHGVGEKLVSGEAEAAEFTIQRKDGRYKGPAELKRYAKKLHKLAKRLEKELGCPQDIEWAVSEDKVYILQSRPISTMTGYNPITAEYNASLTGDYVWSCVNVAEAMPRTMTPFTYSFGESMSRDVASMPGYILGGNIGGCMYSNVSAAVHMYNKLGMKKRLEKLGNELTGTEYINDPVISRNIKPVPGLGIYQVWKQCLYLRLMWIVRFKKVRSFLTNNVAWCKEKTQLIREIHNSDELISLMKNVIFPYLVIAYTLVFVGGERYSLNSGSFRIKLEKTMGETEAKALLASVSNPGGMLTSMGPVAGLGKIVSGEITREEYLEQWGHRSADELEASTPRPLEDPDWLDRRLKEYSETPYNIDDMIAKHSKEFEEVLDEIRTRYPRKSGWIKRELNKLAGDSRMRENIRSEYVRIVYVYRLWCLKAGELTGTGDDIFFLTYDEVISLLKGEGAPTELLQIRRQTYEKYLDLPQYPKVICGRFDPFKWAADPDRNTEIYDSHAPVSEPGETQEDERMIKGIPGSAGVAEGIVRRIDDPEEGSNLEKGEILVTPLTNIGWTLIFPRAGAVVTDIGAPLSHAAVVARELGIPAVISCGDATTRLNTGDRVRVDGARGIVEILEKAKS